MKPSAPRWLFTGVLLLLFAADQATKALALHELRWNEPLSVIPGLLNWTLVGNSGVAFGLLQGSSGGRWILLSALVLLAIGLWAAQQLNWRRYETHVIGGLLVGGALGNWVDRLRLGVVVDFIDFHAGSWHWPAFNLADTGICVSVAYLLLRQSGMWPRSLWRADRSN